MQEAAFGEKHHELPFKRYIAVDDVMPQFVERRVAFRSTLHNGDMNELKLIIFSLVLHM